MVCLMTTKLQIIRDVHLLHDGLDSLEPFKSLTSLHILAIVAFIYTNTLYCAVSLFYKMSTSAQTASRADGRVDDRIENYTKFWQKDPNAEKDVDNENRLSSYTDVVNGMSSFLLSSV